MEITRSALGLEQQSFCGDAELAEHGSVPVRMPRLPFSPTARWFVVRLPRRLPVRSGFVVRGGGPPRPPTSATVGGLASRRKPLSFRILRQRTGKSATPLHRPGAGNRADFFDSRLVTTHAAPVGCGEEGCPRPSRRCRRCAVRAVAGPFSASALGPFEQSSHVGPQLFPGLSLGVGQLG